MQRYIRFYAQCAALFILTWLCGCASRPSTESMDYVAFDRAYADQSNQQLLLNLARLANNDPVNFLQLGSFSSQYSYGAALGFTPGYTLNHPNYYPSGSTMTTGSTPPSGADSLTQTIGEFVEHTLSFGGNASLTASTTPNFQYLPLTGSNIVSALTSPINPGLFYEYYDQGWPADLLARIMVASVAVQADVRTVFSTNVITRYVVEPVIGISTNYSYAVTNINGLESIQTNIYYSVITNLAGNISINVTTNIVISTVTNYEYYVNSPEDPTYIDFLDYCSWLRSAQLNHFLTIGPNSADTRIIYSNKNETNLTGIVSAIQANLTVRWDTNNNQITISQTPQQAVTFIENTNTAIPTEIFLTNVVPAMEIGATNSASACNFSKIQENKKYAQATNIIRTFSIDEYGLVPQRHGNIYRKSSTSTTEGGTTIITNRIYEANRVNSAAKVWATGFQKRSLKMRTVEAAMYTVAKEEGHFRDQINNTNNGYILTNVLGLIDGKRMGAFTNGVYSGVLWTNQWLITTNYCWLLDTNLSTNAYAIMNTNNYGVITTNYFGIVSQNYPYLKCNGPTNCVVYLADTDGPYAIVARANETPFVVRPLLRMTCGDRESRPKNILVSVSYSDAVDLFDSQNYFIGDPPGSIQNRDVFTLLTYLFTQTTVNTQNLPVQQLIQVQ